MRIAPATERRARMRPRRRTPSNEAPRSASVDALARAGGDPLAMDAARVVIERAREEIQAGSDPGDLAARLRGELMDARRPRLRGVLNATGVVIHTNLGRAPLAEEALARVVAAARGYSNLEY